jgi:FkbM family methyltransferase
MGYDFEIADTISFYGSYKEIFVDEIYRFHAATDSPVIIDCGANYGTSVVYFKTLYPNARITAVEADPFIFTILKKNIGARGLSDVVLIDRAVSKDRNPATFYTEGSDAGRVHALDGARATQTVESVTLDDLLSDHCDFLKLDIEGSETGVLLSCKKLANVSKLFVEYHSFADCDQTLADLLEKLSENGFRYYIHSQFCSDRPFVELKTQYGMDLQLNIFARK